jgi:mutator protein MutT
VTQQTIRVVAAVIQRQGKYLVCRRPLHKRHGGLWEFPGGKVEPDESDIEAMRRELGEELGVKVIDIGLPTFMQRDGQSPFVIVFIPTIIRGDPTANEHDALQWSAIEELVRLPLAPSDSHFVAQMRSASSLDHDSR